MNKESRVGDIEAEPSLEGTRFFFVDRPMRLGKTKPRYDRGGRE